MAAESIADSTYASGSGRIVDATRQFSVSTTSRLEEVEPAWRTLAASGIQSPGQSFDFIAQWLRDRQIPERRQVYVTAFIGDAPVALLALHRRLELGIRVLTWFPGRHVGCNAPLVDAVQLAGLGPYGRRALWAAMAAAIGGADLLALRAVAHPAGGSEDIFAELGTSSLVETLYRAEFESWAQADGVQRSKSRRKHDRQQGDKLTALGTVGFEVLRNGDDTGPVLDTMFAQRAARFRQMGVADPFSRGCFGTFYARLLEANSGVDVRLHVLRLDGDIVATRYNIVAGDRMFCLISSMSVDPAIQGGSPGKQCLLRVMQSVFDEGFRMFDMGAGFTDEKRHWCNTQMPLRLHYLPLTLRGRAVAATHDRWQLLRARLKADRRVIGLRKHIAKLRHRDAGKPRADASD